MQVVRSNTNGAQTRSSISTVRHQNLDSKLKRALDVVLAASGLAFSLPLSALIAAAVKLEDGGSVFYRQIRVGEGGRHFAVFKFRSMIPDAEQKTGAVWADVNDRRVTRVGRLLRATAMDEIPQLLNILRGDMSFVGPRPERPEFVEKFGEWIPDYCQRFMVRPGLTGLAQVFGEYDSSPRHKLKYDLLYVRKGNLGLDLKLIMISFWITFSAKWEHRGRKPGTRR